MFSVFEKQNNTETTPQSTTVNKLEKLRADKAQWGSPHVGDQAALIYSGKQTNRKTCLQLGSTGLVITQKYFIREFSLLMSFCLGITVKPQKS